MTQWAKVLATKLKDKNSIPRICLAEKEMPYTNCGFTTSTCTPWHRYTEKEVE